MSDITPIRLDLYEQLAVRGIHTVGSTKLVEPGTLVDSPGDWDILAFSGAGEGQGLVLLGKRKAGGKWAPLNR